MKRSHRKLVSVTALLSSISLLAVPLLAQAQPAVDALTVEEMLRMRVNSELPADADFFAMTEAERQIYAVQAEENQETTEATPEELPADQLSSPETTNPPAEEKPGDWEKTAEESESATPEADSNGQSEQSGEDENLDTTEAEKPATGSFLKQQPGTLKEVTVAAPFYADVNHYTLPGINGVQWIVNGKLTNPGTHKIATPKQRKRLIISAWTADAKQFKLVGTTSWVLQPGTFAPTLSNLQNAFHWELRQQIGHGWTGKIYTAGNFNGMGGPDLFRITPQGQLVLYTTLSLGRFHTQIKYGYGWDKMTQIAGGYDFNGDATPDLLAVDKTGRLYLYPGNGKGGFKAARTPFGYGWNTFKHLVLLPSTQQFGPRLVATHNSGQMFVYEGNGNGGFKGGRVALGFGWNQIHKIVPGSDWNHDSFQDLLVVNQKGELLLYPGNATGYWGRGTKVGQGWTSMGTILSIEHQNQNILWTVDKNYRLWHYKNKQNGYVPQSVDGAWGFNTTGYKTKPNAAYPYSHKGGWVRTAWQVDANNVPIVQVPSLMNGQRIYHPVAYSRFALDAVENYLGNEPSPLRNRELARAKATAQALVNGAYLDEDTLWFPYSFPYQAMGSAENTMPIPWYSSMSQGFALATFVRLSQATGEIKWRQYADMTFASYFADSRERDWISLIDDDGNLWLEEYPETSIPTKVLNGHLFSAESLQYYWLATGNSYAEGLVDGAVTSVVREFSNYRYPGNSSLYCASIFCWRVGKNPYDYHRIVANQIRDFGYTLERPELIELAKTLYADR